MLKKTKFYFMLCILGIFANSGCDVDTGAVSVLFVCSDGAKKCDNNNLLECVNNRWKNKEDCSFECIKIDENNAKCGECKSGSIACDENDVLNKKYKLCQNGEWRTGNDWICQKGCFNGECRECDKGFCNPVSEQYFQCKNDGKYVNKSDLFGAMCGEINTTCESSYCENGPDKIGNSCGVGAEMKPCGSSCYGNTCGECINGKQKCIEKDNKGKQIQCANGSWSENLGADDSTLFEISEKGNAHFVRDCNGSCNKDKTDCGDCYNSDTKCVGDNSYSLCANGTWSKPTTCLNGCDAETGKCITESECNDDKECSDSKKCHEGQCVKIICSEENKVVYGENPYDVIDDCAKKNKICVANEGETPSCECDSANNYEDDDKNGCKCADGYEDSGNGCVKIENNCSSCSNGCFNGKCIECDGHGQLYAVGQDSDISGVSLSKNGSYGCIDNVPFACHKKNNASRLKKYEDPYGCANDTDIFKCETNGELVTNAENSFCGMKDDQPVTFTCSGGEVECK